MLSATIEGPANRRYLGFLAMAMFLIALEIVGRSGEVAAIVPVTEIGTTIWSLIQSGSLLKALAETFQSLAIGFAIALCLGVTTGYLMARSTTVEKTLNVYLDMLLSAPVSALLPVLIIVFGVGRRTIIATVVLFSVFTITVNTYAGLKEAPKELVEMAKSFGSSEWLLARRVLIPAGLPLMLSGIRVAVGRSFNGAIFGEMLMSLAGLGGLMMVYGGAFAFDRLAAVLAVIIVCASTLIWLMEVLERRARKRYGTS